MIDRTKEIQRIIKENGYTSYLEIGLGNGLNFKSIECETKIGVDPEFGFESDVFGTDSDSYFKGSKDTDTFDCIFIDGLHHADQVERDIVNSWNFLNKGGQIIIHDVKPLDEKCQRVPREQNTWTGDVWKAWKGFRDTYPKIKVDYIDERVGLGIIHKSRHKVKLGFVDYETTYEEYNRAKGWEV